MEIHCLHPVTPTPHCGTLQLHWWRTLPNGAGCWSPLTAPCLGARLGANEDWKLVGHLVVVKEPDEKRGWRRGWKFKIRVSRTAWTVPWIISYSCRKISIFKIQGYARQTQEKLPGWPTRYGKHTPPTHWKPCKRYVHSVVTCTLLLPSVRILVDSLLKLKSSHWCRKSLLKWAVFEEVLQRPWLLVPHPCPSFW